MHRSISLALTVVLVACSGSDDPGDGPGGDDDGDGIANDLDLCPMIAGGAYDEDGDKIGDECDACPIARPPAAAETDGDGVDAPCDADPRTGGARILVFQCFNAALPAAWKPTTASAWQVTGGAAIATSTGGLEELLVPITETTRLELFTDYRAEQANAFMAEVGVTAISDLPMATTKIQCGGQRDRGVDLIRLQTQMTNSNHAALIDLFDPANVYGLLGQIEGGDANCAYNSAKYNDAVGAGTTGETTNKAGVFATNAVVRFSYLLVVGH